jgi:pimeloyl-ACP methyl ester carboxylesterase
VDALDRPEQPARTYREARRRFEDLLRQETEVVDPRSRSVLLSPGTRTERVIVFLHGLTNRPRQFTSLSERFLARGYSVLAPRIPYHGYLDRGTTDLARLDTTRLVDSAAAAVDLAAGLADEVTVCGLSLGGILAVWAAQYREVALAAVVETQCTGLGLVKAARRAPPRARSVWVISNEADLAVNNAASRLLVKCWRDVGARNVQTYQFPRGVKLLDDLAHPILEQIIVDERAPATDLQGR